MNETLDKMYELLKDYKHVFLDEYFIDSDNIEDEITDWRNNYMCDDDEFIIVPVYAAKAVHKPSFDFGDIVELIERYGYSTDNVWGDKLLKKEQTTLDAINGLLHIIILQIWESDKQLFGVKIYADEEKGFDIIEEEI